MSLTDEQVVDRLRMALDEVATAPVPETTNVVTLRREERHAGRWLAVAAATVLVAAGVTALAVRNGNDQAPATTPAPTTTPTPVTTEAPTTTAVPPEGVTMPIAIDSPDFVAGEVTPVSQSGMGGVSMAWVRSDGGAVLTLRMSPDDVQPYLTGYGLTDAEIADLGAQIVPGSGLPYLLPVDGWEMTGLGQPFGGSWLEQTFTPAVTDPLSSYIPTVQLTVGDYRGQLEALSQGQVTPVTIHGDSGWRVDLADGTVVIWKLGSTGEWAQMIVAPELSNQVDALVAAIV